jgi:hypothetical protein
MVRHSQIAALAGALSILVYLAFGVASYAQYPAAFNPLDNWLSDLGNVEANPSGALLYRLGCVLAGLLLALLFVELWALWAGRPVKVRIFLLLSQAFGILGAFAFLMSGIYSLGTHASHSFWSAMLFIAFGTAFFFLGWGFLYMQGMSRSLSYLAFAITVADWVMSAFNKTYAFEWVVVALMLVFVGALSYRLGRYATHTSKRQVVPGAQD